MNANTLDAALVSVVLGGVVVEALSDVFALVSGGLTVGGAVGALYGLRRERHRRGGTIDWSPQPQLDWQGTGTIGGAAGALLGLAAGIIDLLVGG